MSLFLAAPLLAQTGKIPSDLRFEVASFKAATGAGRGGGIRPAPGGQRYLANNCPIKVMIMVAYRVKADQIEGGPGWLDSEVYDMEAKAEKPSTSEELHVMLMNLLADRLQLKYHIEKKDMRMYALAVAAGGAKLTAHDAANAGEPWIDQAQQKFLHMKLTATSSTMDYFAFRLASLMDRPVVDQTNLHGGYDFSLEYTRDLPAEFPAGAKINGEDPDTTGPTLFEALKRQLGLELKPQRGPVDVIVIDHVEKPSEN